MSAILYVKDGVPGAHIYRRNAHLDLENKSFLDSVHGIIQREVICFFF